MILNNARIKNSKLMQLFLEKVEYRLEFMFLPLYNLEFSLIEGL